MPAGKKLKVALISAGMIANAAHLPAYVNLSGEVDVVGISDPNERAARETAQRFGVPNVFADAEEMLKALEPDLVSITTPNVAHKPMTMLALSHGANVVCEKPVAITYRDAAEMYSAAEKAGLRLVACQTVRYYPEHLVAKDIVSSGALGEIYFAELSRIRRRGLPRWGSFHKREINGGGAMCDIGVHLLDTTLWVMGNPGVQAVSGVSSNRIAKRGEDIVFSMAEAGAPLGFYGGGCSYTPEEFENEEFGAGTIRLDGGCLLNFKVGWAANLPNMTSFSIMGDKAGIQVPELNVVTTYGKYQADVKPRWFNEGRYKDKPFYGHWHLLENVVNALKGREEFMVKPEETLNVTLALDAFYRSAALGREVSRKEVL